MAETLDAQVVDAYVSIPHRNISDNNIVYDFSGVRIGKAIPQDGFSRFRTSENRPFCGRQAQCLPYLVDHVQKIPFFLQEEQFFMHSD